MADVDELSTVLAAVGPRLRALRRQRGITLADLAETTGISESTLSRLESGGRRPNLELLLPLARAYGCRSTNWSAHRGPGTHAYTCARYVDPG